MKFQYIQEAINLFESHVKEEERRILPCTIKEVTDLELLLSPPYKLPIAYKEFLLYGGHQIAGLFNATDFSYQSAKFLVETNGRDILDMLQSFEKRKSLDPDFFALVEHLGSNMYYIKLTEGENPPVYYWDEKYEVGLELSEIKYRDLPGMNYKSFSEFIARKINVYVTHLHKHYIKRITERNGEY
ncbi:SMI1/KNR4 family protein [Baaleninema simplex]|uniref:SMI1/KNR4 family protein n=1 Tax=Baaleninema simplex TaxID=2862350 RepID=UPI00037C0832|nr:SMI1/KNR4 family protein [Baaleninema simplex]